MKTLKKRFAVVMAAIMVSVCVILPTHAASESPKGEKDLIKTAQFTTQDTDFRYDFAETIEENGKKYDLKSVNYEVLDSAPILRQEAVVHTIDFNNRYSKDVQPAETVEILKDGNSLIVNLEDLTYEATTITNRTEIVSAFTDFAYKTVMPEPAKTKTISYHDNASNQNVTVTLDFKEMKLADEWAWRNDVYVPITVSIYDAAFYALGDKLIPYDNEKPALNGYETDILTALNLDTEKYHITDVQWDGEPYYIGEVKYRNAVATGERYTANYVAVYESRVELPNASGYNAKATYKNTVDVESGKMQYNVQATAVYAPNHTVAYTVVGMLLGLIMIALFIVLVLYILSKKRTVHK